MEEVVHLSKSKSPEFLSAYNKLKLLVVNNRFRPGEQLQACNLADRVVAGITPVREALIRLAAEDLITCYPKRGYFPRS
jgi:DNA-binding GntR family transcriptional regulator